MALAYSVNSRDELDQALAALAELNAKETKINATLNHKLAEVRESYKDKFKVPVDGGEAELQDVRSTIVSAITTYCEEHRDQLLVDGKKSIELTHGKIGWRKGKDEVAELPQTEAEAAKGVLVYVLGVCQTALHGLKKIFTKLPLLDVIRIDIKWDKQQLLKRFDDKQITDSQLTKAGLSITRGVDKFYCEPKTEAVTSGG